MNDKSDQQSAISIGPRMLKGAGFDRLYREGMSLIEEVAAYLDGDGRGESRNLPRESSFLYSTESMRLTTRLMQLASWLLLHRAAAEGEITPEKARDEKSKVTFGPRPERRGGPGWDNLPPVLKDYIAKGDALHERITKFDRLERGEMDTTPSDADGTVADQLSRLKAAFKRSDD